MSISALITYRFSMQIRDLQETLQVGPISRLLLDKEGTPKADAQNTSVPTSDPPKVHELGSCERLFGFEHALAKEHLRGVYIGPSAEHFVACNQ